MKLDLGAGDIKRDGFTSVDLYDSAADIRADLSTLPFDNDSIEEIVCIQVIEHIHYAESAQVLGEMFRVLQPGGTATIETPDVDVVCRKILEEGLSDKWVWNLVGQYHRPHDKERYVDWYHHAGSIHRNPWNFERLSRYAVEAGFEIKRLPWEQSQYPCEENMACLLTKPLS